MTVYRDSNGVPWAIHQTGNRWWSELAGGDGERRYDPEPSGNLESSVERLREVIEAYAKAHRGEVVLRVTSSAGGWWVVAVLAYLVLDGR